MLPDVTGKTKPVALGVINLVPANFGSVPMWLSINEAADYLISRYGIAAPREACVPNDWFEWWAWIHVSDLDAWAEKQSRRRRVAGEPIDETEKVRPKGGAPWKWLSDDNRSSGPARAIKSR